MPSNEADIRNAALVTRLRVPSDTEEVMKSWDTLRAYLLDGGRGSLARDIFESILSHIDEEREEAADRIETLEAALKQCQSVLAMFIHPDTIMETTVLNAYTLATAAEAKARSLLPTKVPADLKPFTFADPARQAEWERQRKERGE